MCRGLENKRNLRFCALLFSPSFEIIPQQSVGADAFFKLLFFFVIYCNYESALELSLIDQFPQNNTM